MLKPFRRPAAGRFDDPDDPRSELHFQISQGIAPVKLQPQTVAGLIDGGRERNLAVSLANLAGQTIDQRPVPMILVGPRSIDQQPVAARLCQMNDDQQPEHDRRPPANKSSPSRTSRRRQGSAASAA